MAQSFVFLGVPEAGEELARNLLEAGYLAAGGVDSADFVVTLCARQGQLEDVYYESDGIIANARPGACVIDCSTTSPNFAKELAAMAAVSDLHFVEAPLVVRDFTVERAYADRDNLMAMVAGEDDYVREARPLLEAMAGMVHACGPSGRGQMCKCAIVMQQCAQLASLMEADALCRAEAGADAAAAVAGLALREQLVSPATRHLREAMVRENFGQGNSYSVEVLWGELESALAAADEANFVMPQAESALYLLELLATIGGASMGPAALRLVYCDEKTVAEHGLDWSRAEQVFRSAEYAEEDDYFDEYDGYGDGYDDYDEHEDELDDGDRDLGRRRGPGFDMGMGTSFGGWSSN